MLASQAAALSSCWFCMFAVWSVLMKGRGDAIHRGSCEMIFH